jgi:ATP-dependent Clp protease protease subunit
MAIYDTMQFIKNDVTTICVGQCASMAALIVMCWCREQTLCFANGRVLIHQPSGGASGQATVTSLMAEEIIRMRELTSRIIARHSGQSFEQVETGRRTRPHPYPIQAKDTA